MVFLVVVGGVLGCYSVMGGFFFFYNLFMHNINVFFTILFTFVKYSKKEKRLNLQEENDFMSNIFILRLAPQRPENASFILPDFF